METVDLNSLAEMLVNDRARMIFKKGLVLQTELSKEPIFVSLDQRLVMQAITNLLTNAMNYTPNGWNDYNQDEHHCTRMEGNGWRSEFKIMDPASPEHEQEIDLRPLLPRPGRTVQRDCRKLAWIGYLPRKSLKNIADGYF